MLAIARAMMLEPKIILLDEPTEGLMPRMVGQISQIIDALHRDGVAILLVEQNVPLTLEPRASASTSWRRAWSAITRRHPSFGTTTPSSISTSESEPWASHSTRSSSRPSTAS